MLRRACRSAMGPFLFLTAFLVSASSPKFPLHRRLPTVFFRLNPSSFFISSPRMFHPPCLISSSNRSRSQVSHSHLPRSLDPSAFYYNPITSGIAPRLLLALQRFPTIPPGRMVLLHDILLCVYDGTQLLLTFTRTMSPCQVGKHVYLIACTDPLVFTLVHLTQSTWSVLLHDGSISRNRLNFVYSLE